LKDHLTLNVEASFQADFAAISLKPIVP